MAGSSNLEWSIIDFFGQGKAEEDLVSDITRAATNSSRGFDQNICQCLELAPLGWTVLA